MNEEIQAVTNRRTETSQKLISSESETVVGAAACRVELSRVESEKRIIQLLLGFGRGIFN